MKLYEINSYIRELARMLDEYAEANEGVVHPEVEALLNEATIEKGEKIESIIKIIRELRREMEGYEKEAAFIRARKSAIENRLNFLKSYLEQNIPVGEKRKNLYYWRETESIQVNDITLVPDIYCIKEVKSKRDIMLDLKNGANIPGVQILHSDNLIIK